jgi:hypothetical protein
MLYRSTDRLSRRGAPVKNLAHSASFESLDKDAPSKPETKQLAKAMRKISYDGYRFPPEIIQQAIWLYLRFTLSFRDMEDLLAERGIVVSYETVRRWVNQADDRSGPAQTPRQTM